MTAYTTRYTIACPVRFKDDGNQFTLYTGESSADNRTFTEPNYQDSLGRLYCVACTLTTPEFAFRMNNPAAEDNIPAHAAENIDIAAANRARALVDFWEPVFDAEAEEWVLGSPASPAKISVVEHFNVRQALEWLGLTKIPEPDEAA